MKNPERVAGRHEPVAPRRGTVSPRVPVLSANGTGTRSNAANARDAAVNPPDWEIKRKLGPGCFRTYAHGYWRPLIVVLLGRVVIGRRTLRRMWGSA